MTLAEQTPELPEHYFRHEFGRLVSVLSRHFGVQHLELCEDAAQTALLRALESWSRGNVPEDRGAWLYRVANNQVLDALRRNRRNEPFAPDLENEVADPAPARSDEVQLDSEVKDDLLRLLFICADPSIPAESQLVLALKTLCGFSTEEIALRLFHSQENVHKRLQRARSKLRSQAASWDTPDSASLRERLPSVLQMLYLIFNEGYSSAQPDCLIRRELCEEAVRLTLLLMGHPSCARPETYALLGLMYLHAARFEARIDGSGGLLLLEEQDRTLWDRELIELGLYYLRRSSGETEISRYHLEALIAVEHCLAPTYAHTRWREITRLYEALDRLAPSPLNLLNRAIALAEWQGPRAGLDLLESLTPPAWLLSYYLWDATLGELYRRSGDSEKAIRHLIRARDAAPTHAERSLLERRLTACSGEP
ncbi:MAG TPA: sigma-70 family RNA polymerase sigma factor [Polyangiaceae bacterium]|nr:sigma-70 family RNA polymerase sigma factor [Polyangiaceae bacterium]